MCSPWAIAGGMATMAMAETFIASEQQRARTIYQAEVEESKAIAMGQQAEIERQKGMVEQRRIDMERDRISRDYQAQAGRNRGLFSSGNVDITGGSAADSLLGNAALYSEDVAANRYNWNLAGWQADENVRQAKYQASLHDSQSSWLHRSAGGVENSILAAHLAGGKTFLSASMMSGAMSGMMSGIGSGTATGITPSYSMYSPNMSRYSGASERK